MEPTAAGKGDFSAAIRKYIQSYIRENVDDMIPAKVLNYDPNTNRATVQPLIAIQDQQGNKIQRAPISNIPVYRPGGNGFFISFPLKAGDFGWLKSSDRDYSLMLQSEKTEAPNTERFHSFSDGMFFPDTLSGWANNVSGDDLSIRNKAGTTSLGMTSGGMNISAANTTWTGNTAQTGNLAVTGKVSATGAATGPNDLPNKSFVDAAIGVVSTAALDAQNAANAAQTTADQAAPVASLTYIAVNAVPTGWLKANGATVSRTTYAALFAVIGTTYGAGDGSTTFKLPDYRGYFLRSWDDGRGVDTGRVFGSTQTSQNLSHNHGGATGTESAGHTHSGTTYVPTIGHSHTVPIVSGVGGGVAGIDNSAFKTSGTHVNNVSTDGISDAHTHGFATSGASASHTHAISSAGGTESRPVNIAVTVLIKY